MNVLVNKFKFENLKFSLKTILIFIYYLDKKNFKGKLTFEFSDLFKFLTYY